MLSAVYAPAAYPDADGDGFGAGSPVFTCAWPAGHSAASGDCDDADPTVSPGAPERCGNLVDDDCDRMDERHDRDTRGIWYADADGDGWGSGGQYELAVTCVDSPGWVRDLWGDCDDADASFHPYAAEICGDGVDRDCDLRDCASFDLHGAWGRYLGQDASEKVAGLGASVAGLGDLDGDGADDLAASAYGPREDDPAFVLLFAGAAGVHGPSGALGWIRIERGVLGLASAGDVDADGTADVWVAPHLAYGEEGVAVLISGAVRGERSLANAGLSRISIGAQHRFGVARAGDPDGDGLPGLFVPSVDDAGVRVWWFDEPGLEPLGRDDARAVFESGPDHHTALAAHGDVDGDGLEDVLVTSLPRYSWTGGWVGIPEGDQGTVPLGADGFTLRETNARRGVEFGLTAAVDLDRDGYVEVITSGEDGVAVWNGPITGHSTTEEADLWVDAFNHDYGSLTVTPVSENALAIGDPDRNTTEERGAIYLLEEPSTGIITLGALPKKVELMGTWADIGGEVSAADVDADGRQDLIIGVPRYPYPVYTEGSQMGAVFLMRAVDW